MCTEPGFQLSQLEMTQEKAIVVVTVLLAIFLVWGRVTIATQKKI